MLDLLELLDEDDDPLLILLMLDLLELLEEEEDSLLILLILDVLELLETDDTLEYELVELDEHNGFSPQTPLLQFNSQKKLSSIQVFPILLSRKVPLYIPALAPTAPDTVIETISGMAS